MKKRATQKIGLLRMPRSEAAATLLERLEWVREQAMKGTVTGFAFVATLTEGKVMHVSHHDPKRSSITELMGEAEYLKNELYGTLKDLDS